MNQSLRPTLLAVLMLAIGLYGFRYDPSRQVAYAISIALGLFILIKTFQAAGSKGKGPAKSKKPSGLYSKNIHYKNQHSNSVDPSKQRSEAKQKKPAGPKVLQMDDYRKRNTPEHPKAGWVCVYHSIDRTQCLLIKAKLESEGIPTRAENLQASSLLPSIENMTLEIFVPKVEEEAALALLEEQNLIPPAQQ